MKTRMFVSLILVVAMLVGCTGGNVTENADGGVSTEVTTKADNTAANGEKLQMLWWSDGKEGEVMQGILDRYYVETGVEIELVQLAYDTYTTKLKTMIRGNETPALARVTDSFIMEFGGYFLTLEDTYDRERYANVYEDGEGQAFTLPLDITANGMFYNKDLFDKYGINYPSMDDEPWTWAEFETEMEKLMDQEDVAYPGVFDNKAHRFLPMIYQFGGTVWEQPYTVSGLKEEGAVEALATLQRMNTNGTLDPSVWAGGAKPNELFKTGKYGFHMSGNWFVAAYQDLPFEWGVVPMPVGNGTNATSSTVIGGKSMAAFDGSGQEEEALKFIEYLSRPEIHDMYTGGVPFLSPRIGAEIDYGEYQDAYEVFQFGIATVPAENVQDYQTQLRIVGMLAIMNSAVEEAMNGKDVRETLADMEEELMNKASELNLK